MNLPVITHYSIHRKEAQSPSQENFCIFDSRGSRKRDKNPIPRPEWDFSKFQCGQNNTVFSPPEGFFNHSVQVIECWQIYKMLKARSRNSLLGNLVW